MVAKKYSEIHKYGGKIYKKINLVKKFGFRVGSGWDLRTQTEPTFYIGFTVSGSRVRVFHCFSVRVRSGCSGRSGFAHT